MQCYKDQTPERSIQLSKLLVRRGVLIENGSGVYGWSWMCGESRFTTTKLGSRRPSNTSCTEGMEIHRLQRMDKSDDTHKVFCTAKKLEALARPGLNWNA